MTERIEFHLEELKYKPLISIVIPSWNNIDLLKLCIKGIKKNTKSTYQIIVHINEGSDGSLEWVKENKLSYTYSKQNNGVCYGYNAPSALALADYIVLLNDDMYVCPNWDIELINEVEKLDHIYFSISGTMIEPTGTKNMCAIAPFDYGSSPENFQEEKLINEFDKIKFDNWSGSSWYPLILHKYIWNIVGGLSVEFSPGMYSDPDFSMKLYHAGVRYFKGVSKSRVYHFQAKTTSRIKKNNGRKQFLNKWGLANSTFYKYYLKLGHSFNGSIEKPKLSLSFKLRLLKDKIKMLL